MKLLILKLEDPQAFLKNCKYIEEKEIRHINDNLNDFSSDDDDDDDEESHEE